MGEPRFIKRLPPAEWLGSRSEIPGDAGARRAGLGTGSTDEQAGGDPHGPLAVARERENNPVSIWDGAKGPRKRCG